MQHHSPRNNLSRDHKLGLTLASFAFMLLLISVLVNHGNNLKSNNLASFSLNNQTAVLGAQTSAITNMLTVDKLSVSDSSNKSVKHYIISVTITNLTNKTIIINRQNQFNLVDDLGNFYTTSSRNLSSNQLAGIVETGKNSSGNVEFDIPSPAHVNTLRFQIDQDSAQINESI